MVYYFHYIGTTHHTAEEFNRRKREYQEYGNDTTEDNIYNNDDYYVSNIDMKIYLDMYDMNECMYKHIERLYDADQFVYLQQVSNHTQYCSICGIKKKRKTRHCPNVNLMHNYR